MKKILWLLLCLNSFLSFAQTETFDIHVEVFQWHINYEGDPWTAPDNE